MLKIITASFLCLSSEIFVQSSEQCLAGQLGRLFIGLSVFCEPLAVMHTVSSFQSTNPPVCTIGKEAFFCARLKVKNKSKNCYSEHHTITVGYIFKMREKKTKPKQKKPKTQHR